MILKTLFSHFFHFYFTKSLEIWKWPGPLLLSLSGLGVSSNGQEEEEGPQPGEQSILARSLPNVSVCGCVDWGRAEPCQETRPREQVPS